MSFYFARIASQSEVILNEKRAIYRSFLDICPYPTDAYEFAPEEISSLVADKQILKIMGKLSLYGSSGVLQAIPRYFQVLELASSYLSSDSPALHERYKEAAQAYNDIILEMRRDGFGWSIFAYAGKRRF